MVNAIDNHKPQGIIMMRNRTNELIMEDLAVRTATVSKAADTQGFWEPIRIA